MPVKNNKTLIAWLILIALMFTWGSSFILIKKGLEVYSSSEVGALRIVISFVFLLPLALRGIRKTKPENWLPLIIVGLIGSGAPAFLFARAQTGIDSNLAGVLNSLTPLFTLLIGVAFFSLKTRWFNVAGVLIGMAGAVGLISISGNGDFGFNFSYAVYVLLATICYAVNVNVVKKYLKELDALTITAVSFLIVGIPTMIYLLLFTDFFTQISMGKEAVTGLMYLIILAVVGTVLALIAFNYLIKIRSPLFASSVTYLIPVIAVFWGVIDGEKFNLLYVLWIILILTGVFLVNLNYRSDFFKKIFRK